MSYPSLKVRIIGEEMPQGAAITLGVCPSRADQSGVGFDRLARVLHNVEIAACGL
jgi:hypothetical protein